MFLLHNTHQYVKLTKVNYLEIQSVRIRELTSTKNGKVHDRNSKPLELGLLLFYRPK